MVIKDSKSNFLNENDENYQSLDKKNSQTGNQSRGNGAVSANNMNAANNMQNDLNESSAVESQLDSLINSLSELGVNDIEGLLETSDEKYAEIENRVSDIGEEQEDNTLSSTNTKKNKKQTAKAMSEAEKLEEHRKIQIKNLVRKAKKILKKNPKLKGKFKKIIGKAKKITGKITNKKDKIKMESSVHNVEQKANKINNKKQQKNIIKDVFSVSSPRSTPSFGHSSDSHSIHN